jgi:hypothetical protein
MAIVEEVVVVKDEITIQVDGPDVVVRHRTSGHLAVLKPHVGRVYTRDLSDTVEVYGESFDQWAERVKTVWGVVVDDKYCPDWNIPFKKAESTGPSLTASLGDLLKSKL